MSESESVSRALPPNATFGTIVERARTLEQAGAAASESPCLLRLDASPSLDADLMLAITPLPNARNDFARFDNAHGAIRVLTRWGQSGPEVYEAAIAAFTATPPVALDATAAIVFLADDRAYVRLSSGAVSDAHKRAVPLASLAESVRAVAPPDLAVIYLTATASTSLAHLRTALEALSTLSLPLALAVPLSADTHLPARTVNANSEPVGDLCADGIEVAESAPEGDLAPSSIQSAVANSQDALASCFRQNAREAAGGARYQIQMLIDARGHVERACVHSETTRDLGFRSCLLGALRALSFPAPQPSGSVLIELPFSFHATPSPALTPLCGTR